MERINFDEELRTFQRAEERMRVAALKPEDRREYEVQLKFWRDYNAQMAYAVEISEAKGMEKGMEKEKIETVKNSLSIGLTPEVIAQITRLPVESVLKLAKEANC